MRARALVSRALGDGQAFPKGSEVALAGALRTARRRDARADPASVVTAALAARGDGGLGLRPRYGLVRGSRARVLERMRAAALARLGGGNGDELDLVPAATRARLALPTLAEALTRVHAPPTRMRPGRTRWRRPDAGWRSRRPSWRSWRFFCGARPRRPGAVVVAPGVAAGDAGARSNERWRSS